MRDRGRDLGRDGGGPRSPREGEGEDAGPPEHRGEGDHLEQGEIDGGGDEQPRAGEQEDEDEDGRHGEVSAQAVQQDRRRDQQGREAQHHHARDLVVQVLVRVQGNASDEGEVHADHGEAELRHGRRSPPARASSQSAQIAPHPDGVDDDEDAADLERGVEERARDVAERPELAEVQLPPQRVGGGEDRGEDPPDEDDQDERRQLHGRHGARAPHESAGDGHQLARGREGRGGRNGVADRDAHCRVCFPWGRTASPPAPRDPRPPSAYSGTAANHVAFDSWRRRNPSARC